jgi:AraC-like DNA-binding protein
MEPGGGSGSFSVFSPPYRALRRASLAEFPARSGTWGWVLVWALGHDYPACIDSVAARPRGVPLIAILPRAEDVHKTAELFRMVERCRPAGVLPYHDPESADLERLLRKAPEDLASEVTDYCVWRGVALSTEGRMLLRRTLQLSGDVKSVNALARSLYVSRRALGRRFGALGLPVPSHILHFGRVLRAYVRSQEENLPLSAIAFDLGYPDAFSLSNQMNRLVGVRPSEARKRLGWEWLIESWLEREGLSALSEDCSARRSPLKQVIIRRREERSSDRVKRPEGVE